VAQLGNNSIGKSLIVGISKYDKLGELDFCKGDANKIEKCLKSLHYEVLSDYVLNGRVEYLQLRDKLYSFFSNAKPEELLFLYFSGHGILSPDGKVYLSTSEIDPVVPYNRGFSLDEVIGLMKAKPSTKIIVVLDCCYGGEVERQARNIATVKVTKVLRGIKETEKMEVKYILASSRAFEESYATREKGSIFTQYVLKGLEGSAIDTEGNVTAQTLGIYIYNKIESMTPKPNQTPVIIPLLSIGGDIILSTYPERKFERKTTVVDTATLLNKGRQYLSAGRYNESIKYFDKVLEVNPKLTEALVNKGLSLCGLKNYHEALKIYDITML
jgi:tetratricopeptide (TPR) repeat protein